MTLDLTRQLGIEFERRIQAIDPTTEIVGKMDTLDIYSYLNQYQLQYVKNLYIAEDLALPLTRAANKVLDILKPLIKQVTIEPKKDPKDTLQAIHRLDKFEMFFDLPDDYYSYVRSVSKIYQSYKNFNEDGASVAPNILLRQEDAQKVIESFYDRYRILRNPVCVLLPDQLEVIHDYYTGISEIELTYIKRPAHFEITGENEIACDLPFECFEDLVTGAVELYFNYKYKVTLASQAARRNAARAELGTGQPLQQQQLEADQ